MDDNLSIKSSDSVTTSGEYEIVPEELESQATAFGTSPTLNIANNGNFNDLEKNLTEVIHELDDNNSSSTVTANTINAGQSTKKITEISAATPKPAPSDIKSGNFGQICLFLFCDRFGVYVCASYATCSARCTFFRFHSNPCWWKKTSSPFCFDLLSRASASTNDQFDLKKKK